MPSTPPIIPAEPLFVGGRRVRWERKGPQFGLVAGGLLFVAAALWMRPALSPMVFWVTVIFFGGGGLWLLVRLLHPGNLFVAPGSLQAEEVLAAVRQQRETKPGLFTYDASGFCIGDAATTTCTWQSISSVVGTTRVEHDDRMIRTEVVLQLFRGDGLPVLEVSDGLWGWSRFTKELEDHLHAFPAGWLHQLRQNGSGTFLLYERNATPD